MSDKETILFVDDEPRVLAGIRRMLHSMRNEWDVSFANGGAEALEMLAQKPFSVIVSDMRMPGMTGVQLLEEVRSRYPKMVRIALSGQSSKKSILRSVGPIHQYLPKPCSADILRSTVARTCALRTLLTVDKLQGVISQLEVLPSLPSLYDELMRELQLPSPSLKVVGKIVSRDIGMSAKISHSCLAVLNCCRKWCFAAEAIGNCGRDESARCEMLGEWSVADRFPFHQPPGCQSRLFHSAFYAPDC